MSIASSHLLAHAQLPLHVDKILANIVQFFKDLDYLLAVRVVAYFFLGIAITLIVRWIIGKLVERHISAHHSILVRRIIFYFGFALSLVVPLAHAGVDVTAILGAAGIFTAAIAFAAQTSISNFLSGVFLIAEKPFIIGDLISVDELLGDVLSIDLLSVKIRCQDNTLVRIPNETLLKSKFRNMSRFPIRRIEIGFRVSFQEDLEKVKNVLFDLVHKHPQCLTSPPPELNFVEFGENGVHLQLHTWVAQPLYSKLISELKIEIQAAFKEADIILPTYLPMAGMA